MGSLYAVDEMIQAIAMKLKQHGELENTVFVLTSDNGYNLGSHSLSHKMAPYEESVRVPMWISGPGFMKGEKISDPVELIDLVPTFLDLAGLEAPEHLNGYSLVTANLNEDYVKRERHEVLLEYMIIEDKPHTTEQLTAELPKVIVEVANKALVFDVPPYRAVRSRNHMFVDFMQRNTSDNNSVFHEYELYDMNADPYQMHNLANVPGNELLFQQLKKRLDELVECTGKYCYKPADGKNSESAPVLAN